MRLSMKTLLEVKHLSKRFEDTDILRDISMQVMEGEFLAIMGQSGSGKSTLLYNISGMDLPTSGTVEFNGEELTKFSEKQMSQIRLCHMGFIFQHSYLLKNLSIRDNIVLPGMKAAKVSRTEVNKNADLLLHKTGIEQVATHDIKKVSGGQLQRAAICRALINQPEILFGDEPTGALNSSATLEIMDLLHQINKEGTTVVLVTHDAKVAARADRIIFLKDGKIHDELNLSKDSGKKEDRENRERKLNEWLKQQGF